MMVICVTSIDKIPNGRGLNWNFDIDLGDVEYNAQAILKKNPLYYDDNKRWWHWNQDIKKWDEVLDCDIIGFIKNMYYAKGLSHSTARNTLLNALKDETRSRKPIEPPNTWIQIGSKIYDIKNNDIIEPSPKYFVKTIIPIEIGQSEDTPLTDLLFKEWLDDRFDVLFDLIAYAMSPVNFIDVFFFLVGAGSNGKGVFTSFLNDFIGIENTTEQNIEILSDPKQRFQTKDLIDKLVCNLGDGNFGVLKETKVLKELAGNKDKIKGELKGSNNPVYFYNKAMLLGSFNTLPQTMDKTIGFYRRCHTTEFHKQFDGKKDIDLDKYRQEYPNLALKCLNRLKELYVKRDLKYWGTPQERKKNYERLSDLIKQFMDAEMVENSSGCFTKTQFHKEFQKWAYNNGRNELEFRDCIARIEARGIDFYRRWVYLTETGYCYGRLEDIPESLLLTSESGDLLLLSKHNIRVFSGYFFKKQLKNT